MKKITSYSLLCSLFLCSVVPLNAQDDEGPDPKGPNCENCASPLYMIRPQGLNSAAIFNPFYFGCYDSSLDASWTFTVGYRYEQTFQAEHIARCLFGAQTLNIAGHYALDPSEDVSYVQAENFGLSPYFKGTITFKPLIQNHNIDFTSRFEFGSVWDNLEGVYCMVNATLTNSRWNMKAEQTTSATADVIQTMPPCLNSVAQQAAFTDIETAFAQTTFFGELPSGPAQYGRFIFNQAQTKTALANLDLILGYDFLKCDGYHFGVFLKTVAPTGNRPNPETVFSPIVGNGHHWEFGGGADGHWDVWTCDDQCITAYIYGAITHLFDDKQWHTFKVYNPTTKESCCLSQYTLLKQYNNAAVPVFENKLIRASDYTTRHINSSFDVQGDASFRFVYRVNGWAFGIGYNVYGRSEESVQLLDDTFGQPIDEKQYGIKGDTGVCALCVDGSVPPVTLGTVSLGATKSNTCVSDAAEMESTPVDNDPINVVGCPGATTAKTWYYTPAQNSTTPKILDPETDIWLKGVPRQVTSKVFGHIDYQWQNCDISPFVGVGGEVEFPFSGNCFVCTPSQWGIWIHGGVEF